MGVVYIKDSLGATQSVDGVSSIGVAGSFVVFQYENGDLVLQREGDITSVQFTATPTPAVEQGDGESSDDSAS